MGVKMGNFGIIFAVVLLAFPHVAKGQGLGFGDIYNSTIEELESKGLSDKCLEDMRYLKMKMANLTLWAMEMWDANAKGTSGTLFASNYHFGNFDECLTIMEDIDGKKPNMIEKQYCLANIKMDIPTERNEINWNRLFDPEGSVLDKMFVNKDDPVRWTRDSIFWAVCAPASCTPFDIELMLDNVDFFKTITDFNITFSASVDEKSCQKDKSQDPFTTGSILFICVFSLLLIISIFATSYHWFLSYKGKQDDTEYPCPPMVSAFSMMAHMRRLTRTESDAGMNTLYGIRVLAICLIVFDHRTGTTIQGPVINGEQTERLYYTWEKIFFQQTEIFVDTFFVLSGLLAMYQMLKYSEKKRINCLMIIFMRYIRLVPLYGMVIFFTSTLLPQTGSGPLWSLVMEGEAEHCRNNWWTNLLMINNYYKSNEICMAQSWYIPCDFHFFVIGLIIIVILRKSRDKVGLMIMGAILFISIIVPMLQTYFMHFRATLYFTSKFLTNPREDRDFLYMYITSHSRLSPYVLGLFTGYIIYKFYKPEKYRISVLKSAIGFIMIVIALIILTIPTWYVLRSEALEEYFESAIYAGLYRPIRGIFSCAFILLCIFGNIPCVKTFLSWKPLIVLGKLTYSVYLVHMGLQLRAAAAVRQPIHFTLVGMTQLSIADATMAFLISFILYLIIESPINSILRLVMSPPRKEKSVEIQAENGHTNQAIEMESDEIRKKYIQ